MPIHYYGEELLDTLYINQSQKFTYSGQFDGEICDKNFNNFIGHCKKTMSWYGTKMILYSVVFVHANWLQWRLNFRHSTFWSKSEFHILMAIWWWDLRPKVSLFYLFLQEKRVNMVPRWHCILLFLGMSNDDYDQELLDSLLFGQSQIYTCLGQFDGEIFDKLSQFYGLIQENSESVWYQEPFEIIFRPSTLSLKSNICTYTTMWLRGFWQTNFEGLSWKKMSHYFTKMTFYSVIFCAWLLITMMNNIWTLDNFFRVLIQKLMDIW